MVNIPQEENMSDTVVTQVRGGRNTKRYSSSTRVRCWAFTLNNYSMEEVDGILKSGVDYVMQEEVGKKGTPHIQGVLRWKNAIRFGTVKKFLPKAHIEPCKNWVASIQYCSKIESRSGKMWSNVIDVDEKRKNGTLTLTQLEKEKIEINKLFHSNFELWKQKMMKKDIEWCVENNEVRYDEMFMGSEEWMNE